LPEGSKYFDDCYVR